MSNKAKRLLSILLMGLFAVSLFSGCGNKKDNSASSSNKTNSATSTSSSDNKSKEKEEQKISFWTISLQPTFNDYFNDAFAKFEKENPGVKIEWIDLPYNAIQKKLLAAVATGDVPDVVNLNTDMALQLASKGALLDLDKEATEEMKSIYFENLYKSASTKDGVYAFPWYSAPHIMIVNKELMEQAGIDILSNPPKTFDEMLEMCKVVKEKTGAYMWIPNTMKEMLYDEGIDFLNEDKTEPIFNTPKAVEIAEKYNKAYQEGIIPKGMKGSWDKMIQLYSTNQLGVIISGPQSIRRLEEEAPNMMEKTVILPSITGERGVFIAPLMNVTVLKDTKNKDMAVKFANFITNDENQLAFDKIARVLPSTKKAAKDSFFTGDTETVQGQAMAAAAEELNKAIDISLGIPNQNELFTKINDELDAAFTGQKTVKEALDSAEKKWKEVLSRLK
jgi:putative chitobiose transport system substrate-binding protein